VTNGTHCWPCKGGISFATFRLTSIRGIQATDMQPDFDSREVTRPLSVLLRLAMLGCPALRARGELAAGACAPVPVWDRRGSSSAGACAWRVGSSAAEVQNDTFAPPTSGCVQLVWRPAWQRRRPTLPEGSWLAASSSSICARVGCCPARRCWFRTRPGYSILDVASLTWALRPRIYRIEL
jgi:hypothetical protein